MLGVITAINALTAEVAKLVTALNSIKTSQFSIATNTGTIATNTTPADDADPET